MITTVSTATTISHRASGKEFFGAPDPRTRSPDLLIGHKAPLPPGLGVYRFLNRYHDPASKVMQPGTPA
jgi:hypothetical protein